MMRLFAFTACLIFYSLDLESQYYFYNDDYYDNPLTWEIGLAAGGMNCLTDLGGKKGTGRKFIKDVNWSATCLYGSIHAGASLRSVVGVHLELLFGQVTASDNLLKNDGSASYGRLLRNLDFRSEITEGSLVFQFHPLTITNNSISPFSPYFLIGIGIFHFSPKTYFNNSWIILSDLHTEGQGFSEYRNREPYRLTQLNMPVGCGMKYDFSAILTVRFEIVYRRLWTDYLDDVSKTYIDPAVFFQHLTLTEAALARSLADRRLAQDPAYLSEKEGKRGNQKNNDAYFSFGLKTALVLGRKRR